MTGKFQMQSHITLISLCHLHRSLLKRGKIEKKIVIRFKRISCARDSQTFLNILIKNRHRGVPMKFFFRIPRRKLYQIILKEF